MRRKKKKTKQKWIVSKDITLRLGESLRNGSLTNKRHATHENCITRGHLEIRVRFVTREDMMKEKKTIRAQTEKHVYAAFGLSHEYLFSEISRTKGLRHCRRGNGSRTCLNRTLSAICVLRARASGVGSKHTTTNMFFIKPKFLIYKKNRMLVIIIRRTTGNWW